MLGKGELNYEPTNYGELKRAYPGLAVCGGGLVNAKHGTGGPDAGGGACMGTTPARALRLENRPELER